MWRCPGPQYSGCPTCAFWSAFPLTAYRLSCPNKKLQHSKQAHIPHTKPGAIICNHKRWHMEIKNSSVFFLTRVLHCPSALTPDQSWPPTHWGRSGLTLCAGGSTEPIPGRFLGSPLLWVHARSSHVTPAALTLQQQRGESTGSKWALERI